MRTITLPPTSSRRMRFGEPTSSLPSGVIVAAFRPKPAERIARAASSTTSLRSLSPPLEREIEALELQLLDAQHRRIEHPDGLVEQLLAGLVALEHDDPHQATASRPPSPSSSERDSSAAITNATCSSKSTPSSSAPYRSSSRLTAAANAGVFIFFLTDLGVIPWMPSGRTNAHAITKPDSSSTANRVFSSQESRETSSASACEATARTNSGEKPCLSNSSRAIRGCPVSRSG